MNVEIQILLVGLALGSVSGVLAGLFGIGGGLVIVPVLAMVFQFYAFPEAVLVLMAVATSLATILLTSLSSVAAHHRLGAVDWPKVWRLAPGVMIGAGIGAVMAKQLPADGLRLILAMFLFYVGLQMAMQKSLSTEVGRHNSWLDYGFSVLIGTLSAIVGIGGGTLTVPYLLRRGMVMLQAVAVSSACGMPIALVGTLSYAWLGWSAENVPNGSLGFVYLPAWFGIGVSSICTAPLGAKLAHRLPTTQLKRYFSALLFIMALKLLG